MLRYSMYYMYDNVTCKILCEWKFMGYPSNLGLFNGPCVLNSTPKKGGAFLIKSTCPKDGGTGLWLMPWIATQMRMSLLEGGQYKSTLRAPYYHFPMSPSFPHRIPTFNAYLFQYPSNSFPWCIAIIGWIFRQQLHHPCLSSWTSCVYIGKSTTPINGKLEACDGWHLWCVWCDLFVMTFDLIVSSRPLSNT